MKLRGNVLVGGPFRHMRAESAAEKVREINVLGYAPTDNKLKQRRIELFLLIGRGSVRQVNVFRTDEFLSVKTG